MRCRRGLAYLPMTPRVDLSLPPHAARTSTNMPSTWICVLCMVSRDDMWTRETGALELTQH